MTSRKILVALSFVLISASACSKSEKKHTCAEVADVAKKWSDESNESDSAQLHSFILKSCTDKKWSEPYKRCVVASFGADDPMAAGAKCEETKSGGDKKAAQDGKTTEASQFLKKMSDAARSYYMTPNVDSLSLTPLAKQFPKNVGPTPPLGACCKNGDKCSPMDGDWETPSWAALDFAMNDPHHYSYQFVSDEKSYTAIASGDLDCDGEYSTFSYYGEIVDGEVMSAGDVIKVNPLE